MAGIRDITLIRVEQVAPFPYDLIGPAIQVISLHTVSPHTVFLLLPLSHPFHQRFPRAELVWVQEEPKNQGMIVIDFLTCFLACF